MINPRKNCFNSARIRFICLKLVLLLNSKFRAFFVNIKFQFNYSASPQCSAGSDVIIKNARKFELLYIDKFLEYVLKRKSSSEDLLPVNVSELPLVQKWPAVKVERSTKTSVLLLKWTFFSFFQLWRLAIFEPLGVQRHNVPHFKGLIVLYLDSRSARAWQHFYLPPRL